MFLMTLANWGEAMDYLALRFLIVCGIIFVCVAIAFWSWWWKRYVRRRDILRANSPAFPVVMPKPVPPKKPEISN